MPDAAWLTDAAMPIAHRGLHRLPDAPENAPVAFRAAADAGYPAELDVRLSADGVPMVFHDADLGRMTGVDGPLAARTAAELSALCLLGTDESIPTLAALLGQHAGRTPLLIELKSDASDPVGPLEDATLAALAGYAGSFALQSFRAETVAYLRAHAPASVPVGQLASDDAWAAGRTFDPDDPPPDFLAYHGLSIPTPVSTALHQRGVPLIVWTVRDEAEMARARWAVAEGHIDNYIFDHVRP